MGPASRVELAWGDARLLYNSGWVQAPGVVKPEIDVRGLH